MNYKIYQVNEPTRYTYQFTPWEFAKTHGFTIEDYIVVYTGNAVNYKNGTECKDVDTALEILFTKFNIHRPSDFIGHSLNVSDVVELIEDGKSQFYYCDTAGWKNITEEVIFREATL